MARSLHPYRGFLGAPKTPGRGDPLRACARGALAFVVLAAAAKLGVEVSRGFDGDGWVAACVVLGAARCLAARSDGS
jgi:hypothetical protein